MADLAGEIEDDILPADEIVHRRLLADVRDVHPQAILETMMLNRLPP